MSTQFKVTYNSLVFTDLFIRPNGDVRKTLANVEVTTHKPQLILEKFFKTLPCKILALLQEYKELQRLLCQYNQMIPPKVQLTSSSNVSLDHLAYHRYQTMIDIALCQYYGINMQADMDIATLENTSFSSQNPQPQDLWGEPLQQDPYDYSEIQLALSLGLYRSNLSLQLGNLPQPNVPSSSIDILACSANVLVNSYQSPQKR